MYKFICHTLKNLMILLYVRAKSLIYTAITRKDSFRNINILLWIYFLKLGIYRRCQTKLLSHIRVVEKMKILAGSTFCSLNQCILICSYSYVIVCRFFAHYGVTKSLNRYERNSTNLIIYEFRNLINSKFKDFLANKVIILTKRKNTFMLYAYFGEQNFWFIFKSRAI